MKKIMEFLEKVPVVLVGGAFLVLALVLSVCKVQVPLYLNPAWVTVLISGTPLVYLAVYRIIHNKGISKISSALLISVAMIAAIIIGDLFAAGEVAFIMAIGEILEDKTTDRARKGLEKLINLAPQTARLISGGQEKKVDVSKISVGDRIRVVAGETIPADGVVISGETSIDESVMTGEFLPADKQVGDSVFCGTVNRYGVIEIEVTKRNEDSSLQKLIRLVKEAEDKKAPMQRIADKWASILVPVAMLIAIVSGIVMQDITVAVTVLVVFCPCALVLATPTAIMAAIGQATGHGVIIKSGQALEIMGKADVVAFDKTGTLTRGDLEVCDIVLFGENTKDELLKYLASAEKMSEHPLGKAIVCYAEKNGVKICEAQNFVMTAGKGVCAEVDGSRVVCGNEKFLVRNQVEVSNEHKEKLDILYKEGKAVVLISKDGVLFGAVALSDTLREDSAQMIEKLNKQGVETVLLTGDNQMAAEYVAKKVGINKVYSSLLPEDKTQKIKELEESGKTVCMIGDGVNDAPALKTASVSVAMAKVGSDIAVDAASIALVGDDIAKIPYLKRLSNATVKTIRLSIALSLLINFAAIILSLLKVLDPTTGALVHNAGSCAVVLIAALLYDRKFDK